MFNYPCGFKTKLLTLFLDFFSGSTTCIWFSRHKCMIPISLSIRTWNAWWSFVPCFYLFTISFVIFLSTSCSMLLVYYCCICKLKCCCYVHIKLIYWFKSLKLKLIYIYLNFCDSGLVLGIYNCFGKLFEFLVSSTIMCRRSMVIAFPIRCIRSYLFIFCLFFLIWENTGVLDVKYTKVRYVP